MNLRKREVHCSPLFPTKRKSLCSTIRTVAPCCVCCCLHVWVGAWMPRRSAGMPTMSPPPRPRAGSGSVVQPVPPAGTSLVPAGWFSNTCKLRGGRRLQEQVVLSRFLSVALIKAASETSEASHLALQMSSAVSPSPLGFVCSGAPGNTLVSAQTPNHKTSNFHRWSCSVALEHHREKLASLTDSKNHS